MVPRVRFRGHPWLFIPMRACPLASARGMWDSRGRGNRPAPRSLNRCSLCSRHSSKHSMNSICYKKIYINNDSNAPAPLVIWPGVLSSGPHCHGARISCLRRTTVCSLLDRSTPVRPHVKNMECADARFIKDLYSDMHIVTCQRPGRCVEIRLQAGGHATIFSENSWKSSAA